VRFRPPTSGDRDVAKLSRKLEGQQHYLFPLIRPSQPRHQVWFYKGSSEAAQAVHQRSSVLEALPRQRTPPPASANMAAFPGQAAPMVDYEALKEQWGEIEDRDGVRLSWNTFPSSRMVRVIVCRRCDPADIWTGSIEISWYVQLASTMKIYVLIIQYQLVHYIHHSKRRPTHHFSNTSQSLARRHVVQP